MWSRRFHGHKLDWSLTNQGETCSWGTCPFPEARKSLSTNLATIKKFILENCFFKWVTFFCWLKIRIRTSANGDQDNSGFCVIFYLSNEIAKEAVCTDGPSQTVLFSLRDFCWSEWEVSVASFPAVSLRILIIFWRPDHVCQDTLGFVGRHLITFATCGNLFAFKFFYTKHMCRTCTVRTKTGK